jgi:hypothetical protein
MWMPDLLFGREIEQLLTLGDVEALSDMITRIRARATKQISSPAETSSPAVSQADALIGSYS